MKASGSLPLRSLLVPAVITLIVTLLRLAGELMGGPRRLFGDAMSADEFLSLLLAQQSGRAKVSQLFA